MDTGKGDDSSSSQTNIGGLTEWMNKHKIISVILILALIGWVQSLFSHPSSIPASAPVTQTSQPITQTAPGPKTEEQTIADIANSALQGTSDISYRGVEIDSDSYQRPTGSKMATVSFYVSTYFSKDSLTRDTGTISSKTFQGLFNENPKMQDAFMWFYGDVTDPYGNKKQDVILTYTIDRKTFAKINWSNFNQANLCNFLEQENIRNGDTMDTGCKVLANIQ